MSELLKDIRHTLIHARTFITSREKMHPAGVELYDKDIERLTEELNLRAPEAGQKEEEQEAEIDRMIASEKNDDGTPLNPGYKPQAQAEPDDWFRVEVTDGAGQIVAIETEMLAGRNIGDREEATIKECAKHLLAFIGVTIEPAEGQEPVAWRIYTDCWELYDNREDAARNMSEWSDNRDKPFIAPEPLYAQPQRPAVPNITKEVQWLATPEAVLRAANAVISHWNEFGPEHGFDECMDYLEAALTAAPAPERPSIVDMQEALELIDKFRQTFQILAYMGVFKDGEALIKAIESGEFTIEYELNKDRILNQLYQEQPNGQG